MPPMSPPPRRPSVVQPSAEQEIHTLRAALPECARRLRVSREVGDDLSASLAESDLNLMLDRLAELDGTATEATEATEK